MDRMGGLILNCYIHCKEVFHELFSVFYFPLKVSAVRSFHSSATSERGGVTFLLGICIAITGRVNGLLCIAQDFVAFGDKKSQPILNKFGLLDVDNN